MNAIEENIDKQLQQTCTRNVANNKLPPTTIKSNSSLKLKRNHSIPDYILNNLLLKEAISLLPINYNFEIHKTIWKILNESISSVALQFPEGLLMYSCIISDIIMRFTGIKVIILGDVTYGACCIDDFTAQKLGAGLLIHYGHSCLVPINTTKIKVLYIFVEIQFDTSHLLKIMSKHFTFEKRIALMGTIQFTNALHLAYQTLHKEFPNMRIPQAKPLSPGETLGCTSPLLTDCDCIVFVADGRFHLEAAMIQNPEIPAYRYDPYSKIITSEGYDTERLKQIRWDEILKARRGTKFGLILGTLGRQGSLSIYSRLKKILKKHNKTYLQFLMAEINPNKLDILKDIDVWVQVSCPRLSIDWGSQLTKPLLTPYELQVALEETSWKAVYPMDYYSNSGSPWSNFTK